MLTRRTRIRPAEPAPEVAEETTTVVRRTRTRAAPVEAPAPAAPATPIGDLAEKLQELDAQSKIIAKYKEKATSPKLGIRAMCVTCMGGYVGEIANCTSYDCPLYPFRMGENPFHKLSKHNKG